MSVPQMVPYGSGIWVQVVSMQVSFVQEFWSSHWVSLVHCCVCFGMQMLFWHVIATAAVAVKQSASVVQQFSILS
jgi:hypothetical protein